MLTLQEGQVLYKSKQLANKLGAWTQEGSGVMTGPRKEQRNLSVQLMLLPSREKSCSRVENIMDIMGTGIENVDNNFFLFRC